MDTTRLKTISIPFLAMTLITQVPLLQRHQSLIVRNTFVDFEDAGATPPRPRRSTTWPADTRYPHEPLRLGGDVIVERFPRNAKIQPDKPTPSQARSQETVHEHAHHHHDTADHPCKYWWLAVPDHILESFPHRIPLQTLDVPPTFTFHVALAIALRLEPSVVLAATE